MREKHQGMKRTDKTRKSDSHEETAVVNISTDETGEPGLEIQTCQDFPKNEGQGQSHKFAKVPLYDLLYMRTKYLCLLNGSENNVPMWSLVSVLIKSTSV